MTITDSLSYRSAILAQGVPDQSFWDIAWPAQLCDKRRVRRRSAGSHELAKQCTFSMQSFHQMIKLLIGRRGRLVPFLLLLAALAILDASPAASQYLQWGPLNLYLGGHGHYHRGGYYHHHRARYGYRHHSSRHAFHHHHGGGHRSRGHGHHHGGGGGSMPAL